MRDVMVDLETTGVSPDVNAIIQIAAVRFNYETLEVGPAFCASLDIAPGRFWDEDTRTWWMGHHEVYAEIVSQAREARTVWGEFADWCRQMDGGEPQRLWAKPVHFEYPFLQSYGRMFQNPLPFHYRNAVDLNSFTRGLMKDPKADSLDRDVPFVGNAHNAIDDVLHQIKVALTAKVKYG
jgi:DNA polymerase III alpha subunit (gram-positive type)